MPLLLKVAVVVAALAAGLLSVGPFVGVVSPELTPAYHSGFLLVLLAAVPVVLAVGLLVGGRAVGAAGVLVGSALLGLGRVFRDLQLVSGPLVASRPELAVATSLAPLKAGTGTWLLIAGNALTLVAGMLVIVRAGARPGSVVAVEFEEDGGQRRQLLAGGLVFGGLATLGLLMPAFYSDNAFVLTPDLMNGPGMAAAGGWLMAAAALFGSVLAATSQSPKFGRGVLLGLGVAVLGVLLPSQIAAAAVEWLQTDGLSVVATVGAIGLIGTAVWPAGYVPWRQSETKLGTLTTYRSHVVAGVLAILAGITGLLGRAADLVVVERPTDKPITQTDLLILLSRVRPQSYADRLLLPAGLLLLVLGVLLLIKPIAAAVRPALSVGWVAMPLAGLGALDAVVTATNTSTAIRSGTGVVWTVIAVVLAIAAAVFAGAAGGLERDTLEQDEERRTNIVLAAPIVAAAMFAVGAFGLPTMRAAEFAAPGLWQNLRLASWGLLLAVVAILIAIGIATRSRPGRAAMLLLGAAAVVGVHAMEFPLTSARAAGAEVGPGTWLSLACIAALVISAFVALAVRPERR
ncbi:hypothetical protein EV192_1011254 [Actinocrispum wychmicini]|uniref:Uncharacterized protein n=1 Tax=Actinocrispum wychmicini TaxID=1213861 RepID=A0A4R2K1C0_9PSEU|nr:hypothetical protein EV192_1011254 [Actinocrispum wychmicini]